MPTITQEQALVELKARGVDPQNSDIPTDSSTIDPKDALAELQRRGINVPQGTQNPSLPSYASPQQQQQMPISSMIAKGLGIGMEGLQAPFQAVGEPIRRAIKQAQGTYPGPYRAPTIIQRAISASPMLQKLLPSLAPTEQQAPDMISAIVNPASAGIKGLAATEGSLFQGKGVDRSIQSGAQAVNQPPGLPEQILATGAAIGSGEAGNIPFTAAIKPFAAIGKLLETGEMAGIPGTGMLGKAAAGADAVPMGLENLTAHANPEVLEAATKNNIPATPGMLTGSPTLNAIESFGKKLPFSSNIFQKRFGQIYDAMNNMRAPIVETSKPAADLGLDVQQGLSASTNAAMGKAQALYSNAEKALPAGVQIPISNVKSIAADLSGAQAKLPPGARASGAGPILADLADTKGTAAMDYPTLQALRSELTSRIAQANTASKSTTPGASFQAAPEARFYGQIKDAVDKDLNAFSDKTGGTFQSAYSEANKTYQTYKQTYKNDKFVQSIMNEQNPENVVNKVIAAARNNPRALGTLKLNLPSQTLNDLQTYFIKDISEKDPNVFSPSYFARQYDSIGEKQLTNILGPDKMAELRPLYVLSKAGVNAESSGQAASGPSGAGMSSAMAIRAPIMAAIGGAAAGHPVKGALAGAAMMGAEMEGLPLMAKAYLSKPIGKLLTRQVGMVPSFPTAGQVAPLAAKLGGPLNSIGQDPQSRQILMQLLQRLKQGKKPPDESSQ